MKILIKPQSVARSDRVMEMARQIARNYVVKASSERPVSTLKADPAFSNPAFVRALDMKTGFMFLYNNRIKNSRWSWAAFTTAVLYPQLVQRPPSGRDRAQYNKAINQLAEFWTDSAASSLVKVKKLNNTFEVSVPVFTMPLEGASTWTEKLKQIFCGNDQPEGLYTDPAVSLTPQFPNETVTIQVTHTQSVESLRDTGGIFKTAYLAALKGLNNGQVSIAVVGEQVTTFLTFEVTSMQAEYLCQTPWMQIRPIDFYGLIREWIDGRLGYFRDPPKFALPLSSIAQSIQGVKGESRANEHGILIDENADLWYIPQESNNVGKYDSELRAALSQADGVLCAIPLDKTTERKQFPPSQPIFTDWVNLKFAYSNRDGKLMVKSLDRSYPVNATHAARLLRQPVNGERGGNAYTLLRSVSTGNGNVKTPMPDLKTLLPVMVETIRARDDEAETEPSDITFADILTVETNLNSKKAIWEAIALVNELAATSFETLCIAYTVQTVCSVVAVTKIAELYGKDIETTFSTDREARKKYEHQGVDANYQGESIPFVGEGKGLMPHQVRAQNVLRNSPEFAILAVSAGGGKTTMILTDALKEMKLGHVHRVLIMCPSHLVGQYVKEFVYFTEGRVNVIAVNSYTMSPRRHGLSGLEQMIRTAPVNTVVVTDYNIGNGKSKKTPIGYGVAPTNVFPVVEMLRKFKFDYVACDESHYLKGTTGRQNAVARLISDIPYKRLASGTVTPNSLMDLVKQVSLFDPSIFGSQADFINKYADDVRGNKVMSWKPGAENDIMSRLKSSVVVVNAKRKEWAAFLPLLKENTHMVSLTPKQQHVYKSILEEVTLLIQEEMSKNKALRFLLTGQSEDGEDEESNADDLDIDSLLKPYLQRLERYVISPAADPLATVMLEGEDRVSPKVLKVIELVKKHLDSNTPGKVLIFCNYNQSAQTIFECLPPELKAQAILYTASNKAECGAEFETNPNKKIMVGVEVSMNTGLNLQFCFTADTPVLIDRKTSLPIKDIYENDAITEVLSYDLETKKIEPRKILRKIRTKVRDKDKFVSVSTQDNKSGERAQVKCTDNHTFFLKGGKEVQAKDLKVGDQLITYGRKFDQLKLDADGSFIPRGQVKNVACAECGYIFRPGPGLNKHRATVHGIDTEKFANYKQTQVFHATTRWEDDTYRELIVAKRKAFETMPAGKAARKRTTEGGKKAWKDPVRRAAHSNRLRALWADDVYKKVVGAAIAKACSTDEARKAMSKRSKANWKDAAYRELISKRRNAYWEIQENREARSVVSKGIWEAKRETGEDVDWGNAISDACLKPASRKLRSSIVKARHATDPSFTAKGVRAMLKAQGTLPNKPERNVISLEIPGLKYVGDGQYFVSLEIDGQRVVKNPDFISTEHTSSKGRSLRVVEVIGARQYTKRGKVHDRKLIKAYADKGIECLIIEADACYDSEGLEKVHARLDSFINNHYLTVNAITPLHSAKVIGDYKYDLEVEGNHNFFACGTTEGKADVAIPVLVHNCSRLIRVDSVWTPGALEQGNSRIGRPNIKVKEERKFIYIDWVIAAGTIDVTKLAYLVSKKVVITKFEEAGNPLYSDENVPSPDLFPMTLDVIARSNETTADELRPAFEAYTAMHVAQFKDYAAYREQHPEDMNEDGSCRMTPIVRAPNLPNSKLMYRVPYVPGLDIYKAEELGLVRYDQFLMQDLDDSEEDDEDEGEEKESIAQKELSRAEFNKVSNFWVHTEYGDGQIVGLSKRALRIELSSGNKVVVNKLAAFVINRAQTNHGDMRTLILKESGDIPFDVPYDIQVKNATEVVIPKKKAEDTDERIHVALEITVVNDFINLEFDGVEKNPGGARALEGIGFTQPQPYMYAVMKTPQHMFKLFKAWTDAGFTFDAKSNNACKNVYQRWMKQRKNAVHQFGMATDATVRSFFQMQHKANADMSLLFPYPLIYEDQVYVAMPLLGHPATMKAINKVKVPGVRFYKADTKNQLYGTVSNLAKLDHHLALMIKKGFVITNIEDLKKERKRLQKVSPQLYTGIQLK